MPLTLLLTIRFCDGRYHGQPEWPPSPARLFQALVAAAARGGTIPDDDRAALVWLERLGAPAVSAPATRLGQRYTNYVPNNDLDAVGGNPDRIGEIRCGKSIHPRIFDAGISLLYAWTFDDAKAYAERLCIICDRLYQLGRGVDMAWARGEVLDTDSAESRLADHPGILYRPGHNGNGHVLACPLRGSLDSLIARHEKSRNRFKAIVEPAPTRKDPSRTKIAGQIFSQPPKPKFRQVSYDIPRIHILYDLNTATESVEFFTHRPSGIAHLAARIRDAAANRLARALPDRAETVARVFVGRNATEADKARRIRIAPLPSIGHRHADQAVRRVLIEIPPDCPFAVDDIHWAFSGLDLGVDYESGEVVRCNQSVLTPAVDGGMRYHYGVGGEKHAGFRLWRTVTPAALPVIRRHGIRNGSERADNEKAAIEAVTRALRQANVLTRPAAIRVQREPFQAKGTRAEDFAPGTRFPPDRLWHVEIAFDSPVLGPLVIGDGRYLGLGLMAPVKVPASLHAFNLRAPVAERDAPLLARALRLAIMARVRNVLGKRPDDGLPLFFCGHESDGSVARHEQHAHLYFAVEPGSPGRVLIVAPHCINRRAAKKQESEHLHTLEAALANFTRLIAGDAGSHELIQLPEPSQVTPLIGPAREWESLTPYRPTRHASRGKVIATVISEDVCEECRRRGLPRPEVTILALDSGPRGGNLAARLRLSFSVAVDGPVLLGRDSHFGGGLFAAT